MKKTLISFFIFIITILLFLLAYEYKNQEEQFFYVYNFTPEEIEKLEEGDIILRRGYGLVSDMIVETLTEEYPISHCGIICKRGDEFIVVHTISSSISDFDGMQDHNLKTFIFQSKKNSVIVTRLKLPKDIRKKVCQKALYYLDKRIPFDHAFDINDSSFFYCSELLWRIIRTEANIDIFSSRNIIEKKHLYFSHFYCPEFFDIIVNHPDSMKLSSQSKIN